MLALRSPTDVPTSLRSALMGLAVSTPPMGTAGLLQPSRPLAGSDGPSVPVPPSGSCVASYPLPDSLNDRLHDRLPTVRPTAPALHRSPVRAAVVASIAAGASVAAAWGLAVAPLQGETGGGAGAGGGVQPGFGRVQHPGDSGVHGRIVLDHLGVHPEGA